MKHSLFAGLLTGTLLLCGCQSTNWSANNKSTSKSSLAQNENVREVPWSWNGKKKTPPTTELPPEIAAKFEKNKLKPNSAKTAADWVAEGARQETAHDLVAAKKSYQLALDVDPVNADAHHRLGILADMRSEFAAAQDHYEAALRQKPRDPNLLSDIGYSNFLRGNAEPGERYLLQALEINPQHKQAMKNLGTLYASQNRYDEALAAFRRCRPEDAQQLITQFFPHGRPFPAGSDMPQVVASGPAVAQAINRSLPADGLDAATLSKMSREELLQLVVGRQHSPNEPVHGQQLNAQAAGTRHPADPGPWQYENSTANSSRESSATAWNLAQQGRNPTTDAGQNLPPAFNAPPGRAAQNFQADAAAGNRDPKSGMPYWEGAPRQARPSGQQPSRQDSPPPNSNFAGAQRNQAMPANLQPSVSDSALDSSWWQTENNTAAGPATRATAQAGFGDAAGNAVSENNLQASVSSIGQQPQALRRGGNTPTNNQWAYQLGMSAGPGTLFPVITNHAPSSAEPAEAQWAQSNQRGGYPETRASAPAYDSPASDPETRQWQSPPLETAPRSPTDNWGSPSAVPWPNDETTSQAPSPNGSRLPNSRQLPIITPAGSSAPGGNAAAAPRRSDAANRFASGFDQGSGSDSGVVPAWYDGQGRDSPVSKGPAGANPGSVPWPYAPR